MSKEVFEQKNKKNIWILAMFMIVLICSGLDLDGRFSIVLYIFVIIALSEVLPNLKRDHRTLCLAPLIISIIYNHIYLMYKMQLLYYYTDLNDFEGCFLYYKSIFEAPYLP